MKKNECLIISLSPMLVAETFWGRNVFKNLCLNWENLFSVFVCKTSNSELNDLISQYNDVFKSEIGTLKMTR